MKKIYLFILFLVFIFPLVHAKEGSMKLLAVSETNNETGSVANLFLEIKEGTGRVFIDSFPLTKLDTQISTRFAKEIACDLSEKDCSKYDFFYTIRANAPIVGGPSAGAAISVLTVSVLEDLQINNKASITGTINSGGLIGPVGGIKGKVIAANRNNLTKVVIPKWSNINKSDIENLTSETGVIVVEVSNLKDAMYELTGKTYQDSGKLIVNSFYIDTMNDISSKLCEQTSKLAIDYNNSDTKSGYDLFEKGKNSMDLNDFYSAASFCFGANVRFRYARFIDQSLDSEKIVKLSNDIFNRTKEYKDYIKNKKIETITDLQTYMIVNQRLNEANDHLKDAIESLKESNINSSLYSLSFGIERLNSAYSWSNFFGKEGKKYVIDDETLSKSCLKKISEVEERIEYIKLIADIGQNKRDDLKRAYREYNSGDYDLCLFSASQIKADIDTVLNNIGFLDENYDDIIDERLTIVESILSEAENKGVFPILGYSYFEYAKSLKDSDKFSTLLYLEYAVEFSNLDIYFEQNDEIDIPNIPIKSFIIFSSGVIFGFIICFLWLRKEFIVYKRAKKRK